MTLMCMNFMRWVIGICSTQKKNLSALKQSLPLSFVLFTTLYSKIEYEKYWWLNSFSWFFTVCHDDKSELRDTSTSNLIPNLDIKFEKFKYSRLTDFRYYRCHSSKFYGISHACMISYISSWHPINACFNWKTECFKRVIQQL